MRGIKRLQRCGVRDEKVDDPASIRISSCRGPSSRRALMNTGILGQGRPVDGKMDLFSPQVPKEPSQAPGADDAPAKCRRPSPAGRRRSFRRRPRPARARTRRSQSQQHALAVCAQEHTQGRACGRVNCVARRAARKNLNVRVKKG